VGGNQIFVFIRKKKWLYAERNKKIPAEILKKANEDRNLRTIGILMSKSSTNTNTRWTPRVSYESQHVEPLLIEYNTTEKDKKEQVSNEAPTSTSNNTESKKESASHKHWYRGREKILSKNYFWL